jgi:hypothetical protein
MDLEESPLWNEVQTIIKEGPKPVGYYWKGQIHTTDVDLDIMKIMSIDNICNYEANFGDELIIEVLMLMGDYIKVIYPNRANLDITIFKEPLLEIGDNEKLNEFKEAERFKAVPILEGLPAFEGSDLDIHNKFTLNLQTPLVISFQLFNRSLERLRTVTIGGVFRKVLNEDVIKASLVNESLKIKVSGAASILAVDVVPSDNKNKREHTVIPQGVKLLALSTYVQEKCNGVYNYGIGTYLQRKIWYVYPLYNTKRFDEAPVKAIIYKIQRNKLNGIERTYRVDGKTIHILATSSSTFEDDAGTNFMNEGNGVRLADAKQFMNKFNKTVNNKTIINRKKLNSEIVYGEKEDGLNTVYSSKEVIGDNLFLEKTRIAARNGSIVTFAWDNANPKLLIPGMMIKVIYMDHDVMQEVTGVLLNCQVLVQLNGTGITIMRHITTCNLSIFINKAKKE